MIQEPCKKCGEYHNNCYEFSELTDEEIKQVWNDNLAVMGNDLQFAKAILRKAQEK